MLVLVHFILETNALNVSIGAFPLKKEYHVSYFSKKMPLRMQTTSLMFGSSMLLQRQLISRDNICYVEDSSLG